MIVVSPLTVATLHHLTQLGRTRDPEWWIEEVEHFVLDGGALLALEAGGAVLAIQDGGTMIGAAIHHEDPRLSAEYLAAYLIGPEHRGQGHTKTALPLVVQMARGASKHDYVTWRVAKENGPMLKRSKEFTGDPHAEGEIYYDFVNP